MDLSARGSGKVRQDRQGKGERSWPVRKVQGVAGSEAEGNRQPHSLSGDPARILAAALW
jgi:hypothetical protein